jgi:hypothetical protein
MDPEGGGVLRNLPRSRPGTRSDKRPGAAPKPKTRAASKPPEVEADPVGEAVRAVVGAAGAGARAAHVVTRGVLRRLPRP